MVFTLSSHWLIVIFTFALIGRCDHFDFGSTTLIEKRSIIRGKFKENYTLSPSLSIDPSVTGYKVLTITDHRSHVQLSFVS